MCRTIVGVSANLCPVDPEGKNLHSSVSSQFAEGIRQAGGLPMVIPMGDPSLVKDYVETIDKLILSGGQNVDPSLYGEEKTIESDDYNIERDQFELALLKEAVRQNKPVLGICRGVQLINVAFLEEHSTKRSKDIGKDFRLGLPILSRLKKAVWWSNSLVRLVGSILFTVKVSRILHQISVRPPLIRAITPSKRLKQ